MAIRDKTTINKWKYERSQKSLNSYSLVEYNKIYSNTNSWKTLQEITKDTKFRKICFNCHPRYTSTNVHKHTLFLYFSDLSNFLFFIFMKKKIKQNWKIRKIQKQCVFVYIDTCVPWMVIETIFSKLCIFCNLDEHLYTQLSKWALWLVFVMSKIKLSLILNTHIIDGKD